MFPVAILAGGLATRLYPKTKTIPKALVEVAGKPFIKHQLEFLKLQRITQVVLCVGHLGEMIVDVIGNGDEFGVHVSYSYDGDNPLGTGGALKKAIHLLDDNFYILYGDSFLPICFSTVNDAYVNNDKSALMTVVYNSNKWDKSNVLFKNKEILEYNKHQPNPYMRHIDYGLAVVSKKIFDQYKSNITFDLADVYHQLSKVGQLAGFEVHERFYEIGSHTGLKETEEYLLTKEKT
jgi:MurNAc alpha-1-phosphate uridylyltransferase